jgi:hypothetical protein
MAKQKMDKREVLDCEPLLAFQGTRGAVLIFAEGLSGPVDGALLVGVQRGNGVFLCVEVHPSDAVEIAKLCIARTFPILLEIMDRMARDKEASDKIVGLLFPELPE